ncbi:Monopolin complex subunit Csm1/Pcs1 [Penicillium macrosclerotiorum]|uniref:Monopolin complex subunit Csm1/Pcs1 n=1 Tax=Penicillium macrosclerotiorum TaxID=303699 RepID=UPI002547685E|nr:Monopolin complex subunit Csm1/Pcs1 [Penicillium macrosclerotiorum]KAJ5675700.1 Monopolin complex subunit Csm1/Pcs1 [Penicillium macrosclerotiorum]
MPKRKAPTKISGLVESDDEDLMQLTENEVASSQQPAAEPPAKKRRGRPRASNDSATETKPTAKSNKREPATVAQADAAINKKAPTRRGRPRGSSRTSDNPEPQAQSSIAQETSEDEAMKDQENEDPQTSNTTRPNRGVKSNKPIAPPVATRARGRGRAASTAQQLQTDGEFEFTPTRASVSHKISETQNSHPNEEPATDNHRPTQVYPSPEKNALPRQASVKHIAELSPRKRKLGDAEQGGDPELRRRIGDLTKKHDALESKYRNLREIGITEANTNIEKLRKQCETITTASNELVASLKSELEAQRALGQQSRGYQKQLKDRDTEMVRLRSQMDEARSQLAASQSEIKALQTKLAAARNTAASLESSRVPGSAIKGGAANRIAAAATAEAAQAAQIAQLKENLYEDLTGLIVRDVKAREHDHLYDCIQTGGNGALHFKLAVPKVSSSEYESAEFQYLPLLDANRDRDLVNILPDFLTVEIQFSRQQASKFYTRVIDALTKRRSSTTA